VPLVRAKIQGFYNGKRIRPREVFDLNPEHPIGKWMELISEPEEEGLGPQIGVVAGQDTGPTVALEAEKPLERTGTKGRATKPVAAIRELCIWCVGGF